MGLPCPAPPGRLGLLDEFSKSMEEEGLSSSHRDGGPEVILEEDFVMASSSSISYSHLESQGLSQVWFPPAHPVMVQAAWPWPTVEHHGASNCLPPPCSRSTEVSEKGCRLPIQEVPSSHELPSWPGAPCPASCHSWALAVPPATLTAWQL